MANIDKIAIVFSIAIVAIGVGFAAYGGYAQDNAPVVKAPVIANTGPIETKPIETEPIETEPIETEPIETEPIETEPIETEPKTVSVAIPAGTSYPGCETTNACYTPASVTINVGDTVKWDNVDSAAHTVTSGSPADGPSGVFDSSLLMGKASFEHTFDKAGTYDYFCMVHPWMVGDVIVN